MNTSTASSILGPATGRESSRRNIRPWRYSFFTRTWALASVLLPAGLQAQFTYVIDGGGVTITGYNGTADVVEIPNTIEGLPVTRIDGSAFSFTGPSVVAIPRSVAEIGSRAWSHCTNLLELIVEPDNAHFSSLNGVLFDKATTSLLQFPAGRGGHYVIPDGVESIAQDAFVACYKLTRVSMPDSLKFIGSFAFAACSGLMEVRVGDKVEVIWDGAFLGCTGLLNLTLPASVSFIGSNAFTDCAGLRGIYFKGRPPSVINNLTFYGTTAVAYYLPGATGWGFNLGGLPTALWNPLPHAIEIQSNIFRFTVSGTYGIKVVVEAIEEMGSSAFVTVQTLTLTNGSAEFTDPDWGDHPRRFYRLRSP